MPPLNHPAHITVPREALENELLLASEMRTLDIVHRAYAHDVRGPLNAMQLSLELLCGLLLDAEAGDPPGGAGPWQRHVSVLREELAKLNRTVQGLLDQQLPLGSVRHRFDLASLVREVAGALRGQAARQRVQITLAVQDEALLVHGLQDRIRQALLNLAVHALEGMPNAGRLAIGVSGRDETCTLYVEHSGPPLSQEALASLERLQPVACDGRPLAGLCAARLVAQSHGGELRIEAVPVGAERLGLVIRCPVPAEPASTPD
ncbi:MAG: hypothetical protein A3I01_16305 [Betaproteobacteria bacterium RIFCSPLOWO2_02_FULL_65_24]|nr:MAG: hypothetical protein A3I01_16305 [Betaproteobacteria bacterium RIFCSPLOWO2_02_FULL_65_24]